MLKEEVHYSPSNRALQGLRHGKKYSVPESPLLQVGLEWERGVCGCMRRLEAGLRCVMRKCHTASLSVLHLSPGVCPLREACVA